MPLSAQRRHSRDCKTKFGYKATLLDKCNCPMMIVGMDNAGNYHDKEHANTRDKHRCNQIIREIEDGKIARPQPAAQTWTIDKALENFKTLLIKQRGLKPNSLGTHRAVHNSLLKFAADEGIKYLKDLDGNRLNDWIATWDLKNSTLANRINLVKRMFKLAHALSWIPSDPAVTLMHPKVTGGGQTKPYDLDLELPKLMEAAWHWRDGLKYKRTNLRSMSVWSKMPKTATALTVLLRCTGLRISDAFRFNPSAIRKRTINGEEIYCYFAKQQKKTEKPVFVPILPEYAELILNAEWVSDEYAFWDGVTPMDQWHHVFVKGVLLPLGRLAGVENVHPHRFRDTFAVDLLRKRVDIRSVSRLLGHASVTTTLEYYEHYIESDQDTLLSAVLESMKTDTSLKNVVSIQKSA